MKETFYVTTPIYYTNGVPHIGHSYSSLMCDIIGRFNKICGKNVKFTTGVDENSQNCFTISPNLLSHLFGAGRGWSYHIFTGVENTFVHFLVLADSYYQK